LRSTFRSLRHHNYRLWAAGALVSNIGTWMQRTAQDWIVLTQLTHNDAVAVGIVMSLQFGPQLVLVSVAGAAADRLDRRRILLVTQALMGTLALVLGVLAITGTIVLWHVYVMAFLLGCVTAFDAPARQAFVGDLVGETDLSNAVALNATSFHGARLIGPAVAGILVAAVGAGWAFLLNAASFGAVLIALARLRKGELRARPCTPETPGSFREGLRYVASRPDLVAVMLMMFLVSTFGLNYSIFIPAMAAEVYQVGAPQFGALASLMGIGSVAGALYAARQERPRLVIVLGGAAVFGIGSAACALAPDVWLFGAGLVFTGLAAQIYMTSTNGLVQVSSDPAMRGRVMAILMAIINGCTPLGAPLVGWVANAFGPRSALGLAATSGLAAALIGLRYRRKRA
jgi:MFS family permease